ncbi:DNA polymerase III subunit beta [Planococcus massiliensis]|uniref:DNA polymerase III subunit beta n=1 Tax=Planococcus massiliensis TaxID=1499687 RepID=A0A098EMZ4_9BACL|nr:hypothetical protein [Planococcus massiliensis]CEG23162.1 DNA polymerase III subunit beta [Planococcus massiliensis]
MNELTFIHKDLYPTALKLVKNFVSKSETRPILMYSLHTEDGGMWATDSHRLINIQDIHGYEKELLVHAKSGMLAHGEFPKVDHLLSDTEKNSELSIILDKEKIQLWMILFKQIAAMEKALKETFHASVKLNFADEGLNIEVLTGKIRMTLPGEVVKKPSKFDSISFSAEFMKQAMEAFMQLESNEVKISFDGRNKPFLMTDSERVKILLLPIRTF